MENNIPKDKHPEFEADYEFSMTSDSLDELEQKLTDKEELQLKELIELRKNAEVKPTLLKDMLEAAKQGALNYLNSFTDTADTFSEMKDPDKVRDLNDEKISIKENSVKPHDPLQKRTMEEAKKTPFDLNVEGSTEGMSQQGQAKFERYKEAYSQRTKSVTKISSENSTINRSDQEQNFESLSGLRGYRVGPVVAVPTLKEAKSKYEEYKENKIATGVENNTLPESTWLYNENMKSFDEHLVKEFGFRNVSEARQWRKDNNLTVHEGPDVMFLVPRDVHDKVSHNGYRSKMTEALQGKITQEELDAYARKEKIEFVKHEAKTRSVRAVKGIGMSIVRDLLKSFIFIVGEEAYKEFNRETDDSFIDRIKQLIKQTWIHLKEKCKKTIAELWNSIKNGIKGAIMSEFFTLLNDFVFKTAKNIFKIIRTMWSSIYKAIKVILSPNASWGERIFEATKIITAGFVGVVGFSLNELIDKGLTSMGIPFASFISECLSGLFAGIMSSLVLVLFDNIKDKLFSVSPYIQQSLIQQKLVAIDSAKISISSIRLSMDVKDTFMFVGQSIAEMGCLSQNIQTNQSEEIKGNKKLESESVIQSQNLSRLSSLSDKCKDDPNF